MLDAGFDPIGPFPGRRAPWPSYCTRGGHHVAPMLAVVVRGDGCRVCTHRAPVTAAQADDELIRAGLSRLGPWVNADTLVRCRCRVCGADVAPSLSAVRSGVPACRSCAQRNRAAERRSITHAR